MNSERWQHVRALFESALEHAPASRATYLDERCAGDLELRKEVESLLSYEERSEHFLEAAALQTAARHLTVEADGQIIGRRIGAYQVLSEIGTGGMGSVYLAARADDQYQKKVAIKVVRPGMDTEAILRRFRQEQQILATLEHPNVARLLDAGRTDDGLSYFIMEHVDGLPIDRYCDTHRLPITGRLQLLRTVCTAVMYAHEHGVIHRDLKPSNVLVKADGTPKLLDFGIAKLLQSASAERAPDRTLTAWRPMTPEYASPEQVRGAPIGPASDVYSLGVLLYELLTGHRPYRGPTRTPHEIERLICEQEPEKPSTAVSRIEERPTTDEASPSSITPESVGAARGASPEVLRRVLAGDLDTIVLKAVRKETTRRYATVAEFAEDIRRYLESQPVIARKDTLRYRSSKFVQRNKASVLAAGLVAVILVLAVLLGLTLLPGRAQIEPAGVLPIVNDPGRARRLVVLPFISLKPEANTDFLSYSLAETITARLGPIRSLSVVPASAVYKYRSPTVDPMKAAAELKADTILTGNYLNEGDVLRVSAQLVDVASTHAIFQDDFTVKYERLLTLHDAVARRLISALGLNLSPSELEALRRDIPRHPRAWEFYLRGVDHLEAARLPLAMETLEKSVALDPEFAWGWTELGAAYVVNAAVRFGGRDMYTKAQAAFDRAIALNPADPRPQIMMSDMFIETNRVEEATSMLRAIIRQHPHNAVAIWQSSYAYRYAGLLEESAQAGQAAYEADPGFTPRSTVFNTWLYLGQYEKFRDTLPQREGSAYLTFYHGFADYHLKDFAQAAASFDRAYALDPGMLQARVGKALSHDLAGRRAEGLRLMRETAQQLEERGLNDAEGIYKVAQAFAVLGDHSSALHWLHASVTGGFFCYPYFKTDPLLANLRHLPEFKAALERARQRHEAYKRRFF